jgi:hypothetical protein
MQEAVAADQVDGAAIGGEILDDTSQRLLVAGGAGDFTGECHGIPPDDVLLFLQ